MENRINIAELLRKCPEGMELDCVLFDGVVFDEIDDDEYCGCPIVIKTKEGETWNLTSTGCWDDSPSAKCVIFPKGKTTWEGFVPPAKFKVGDKVRHKNNHGVVFTITNIEEDYYGCGIANPFCLDDQNDYELVPNKFDINTLKRFDKVLIRDNNSARWDITFYELYDNENKSYPYRTLGGMIYKYCIPYEGNEHLCGKRDDCKDFYKTW